MPLLILKIVKTYKRKDAIPLVNQSPIIQQLTVRMLSIHMDAQKLLNLNNIVYLQIRNVLLPILKHFRAQFVKI